MTTACQSSPQPHSSGMPAARITSGMATNTPTRTRWNVEFGSLSKSDRGIRGWVLVDPPVASRGEDVVVWSVIAAGRADEAAASVTLTVSGEVVIVLLLVQPETRLSACTLT